MHHGIVITKSTRGVCRVRIRYELSVGRNNRQSDNVVTGKSAYSFCCSTLNPDPPDSLWAGVAHVVHVLRFPRTCGRKDVSSSQFCRMCSIGIYPHESLMIFP